MPTPLFDVVLENAADDAGQLVITAKVIDRYHDDERDGATIGTSPEYRTIDDAIQWARGAVTAFLEGTQA